MENSKNNLTVPVAIIVAGGLIAAAIFLRGNTNLSVEAKPEIESLSAETSDNEIILKPVDSADHILGNPEADIVIVEYSDTECPFCKRFHFTMKQVMEQFGKDGKVAWVYRHFPIIELHSRAPKESEALECAAEIGGNTKFWNYADRLYEITDSNDRLAPERLPEIANYVGLGSTAFADCLSSGRHKARVQSDYDDGLKAGVRGTPYSVIVLKTPITAEDKQDINKAMGPLRDRDGNLPSTFSTDGLRISMSGALPYESVKQIIDILVQ